MKRLLLAGVSLTVTACSMSPASSPSASSSIPRVSPSQYILALAATPDCTLWRDSASGRVCLDSATPEAAAPVAAAPEAPKTPRLARETGQDSRDFAISQPRADKTQAAEPAQAKPAPVVQAAKPADPGMPQIPDAPKRDSTLFQEMQRIGMLDAKMKVVGAPPRIAVPETQQAQAQGLPQLPGFVPVSADLPRLPVAAPVKTAGITTPPVMAPADLPELPKAARGVIGQPPHRAVAVEQAFAAEPAVAASKLMAAPAPSAPAQAWKPVAPAATRAQIAQSDTMGRAPVAPVERAALPSVRSDTVVPLKIAEKATDQRPAVVVPVAAPTPITPTTIAANPGAAPDLPPLPQLPGSSAPVAQPMPAALALPPPPPAVKPVAQPVAAMAPAKPAAKPIATATPAVAKSPAKQVAKPAHSGKLAGVAPSAAPVQPGAARYLVIHSFTDQRKAAQTAQKYSHLGATVATAQIQGQTWYRVMVRDGAAQRERLTADGVRVYWPVSL